jgi:hypothetical protein
MNELYFLPILFKAIGKRHPENAVLKAFDEIFALGRKEPYKIGFDQFLRFMDAVAAQIRLQDDYLESIRSEVSSTLPAIEIIVERDDRIIAVVPCYLAGFVQTITKVKPGEFVFKLNLGRILWAGELRAEELIWSTAFPGEALRLAADTGKTSPKVSRTIPLIQDEMMLRIIPGIESGSIEIFLRGEKK